MFGFKLLILLGLFSNICFADLISQNRQINNLSLSNRGKRLANANPPKIFSAVFYRYLQQVEGQNFRKLAMRKFSNSHGNKRLKSRSKFSAYRRMMIK